MRDQVGGLPLRARARVYLDDFPGTGGDKTTKGQRLNCGGSKWKGARPRSRVGRSQPRALVGMFQMGGVPVGHGSNFARWFFFK